MSEILQQLKTDHENVAKLLDFVEGQLEKLEAGGVPDYALLMDIMQYMTNYPDLFHHPREDIIFERIAERREDLRADVSDILQEHKDLEKKGKSLLQLLDAVIHGHPVDRSALEADVQEYVSASRSHMSLEETGLISASVQMLVEDDWEQINATMESRGLLPRKNPVEDDYLSLYADRLLVVDPFDKLGCIQD